jgi:DNA-binding transcriptional LysR family regulator
VPGSPPPPTTFDLRLVWCFTVVADYRHFGRAAEALHTTQPSLSRQIHRLEQQLGARLFERTPHGNHLTEAGEVFLPHATVTPAHPFAAARSAAQSNAAPRFQARQRNVLRANTFES